MHFWCTFDAFFQKCIKSAYFYALLASKVHIFMHFWKTASKVHQKCIKSASKLHQPRIDTTLNKSWIITTTCWSWQHPTPNNQLASLSDMTIMWWEYTDPVQNTLFKMMCALPSCEHSAHISNSLCISSSDLDNTSYDKFPRYVQGLKHHITCRPLLSNLGAKLEHTLRYTSAEVGQY